MSAKRLTQVRDEEQEVIEDPDIAKKQTNLAINEGQDPEAAKT